VEAAPPTSLGAVDAAVIDVPLGDICSILIQAVRVDADGQTSFGDPIRETGINGEELSLARTPLRMLAENILLVDSCTPTIADTSFWSMLMEVNQTITRRINGGTRNAGINRAYERLVVDGGFLALLENPEVIAMSKSSERITLAALQARTHQFDRALVSDRELLGQILQPGEFLAPEPLVTGTKGRFGVEKRGFKHDERQALRDFYERRLGMTYFKPHPFSRALRIEARLERLCDDTWLMPLLSALTYHTADRSVEPWPQFLADWTTKRLSAIATLYGMFNFPRTPFFDPARTLI